MGHLVYNYLTDYTRRNLLEHKTGRVQPRKLHKEAAEIEPLTSLRSKDIKTFLPEKPILIDFLWKINKQMKSAYLESGLRFLKFFPCFTSLYKSFYEFINSVEKYPASFPLHTRTSFQKVIEFQIFHSIEYLTEQSKFLAYHYLKCSFPTLHRLAFLSLSFSFTPKLHIFRTLQMRNIPRKLHAFEK